MLRKTHRGDLTDTAVEDVAVEVVASVETLDALERERASMLVGGGRPSAMARAISLSPLAISSARSCSSRMAASV